MKNFNELLSMQRLLDNSLVNSEKRTANKIKRSAIAEIIEFDETVEETHKTWKNIKKQRAEQLEELTDILFFLLSLRNHENKNEADVDSLHDVAIKKLIEAVLLGNIDETLKAYTGLAEVHGFTEDEIYDCYRKKWDFNMKREDHLRREQNVR